MPTYEYKCEECGIVFDRFQHFSEAPIQTCPECNGPVHRVICPVGIVFKGSGFYVTDHRADKSAYLPKSKKEDKPAEGGEAAAPAKPASDAPDKAASSSSDGE